MRRVVIESPYAGHVERNLLYLEAAARDCLRRGEAPYASHGMLTQWLDDRDPIQRDLGIRCGYAWGAMAEAAVFYVDLGMSEGMVKAEAHWQQRGLPIERRELGTW